MRVRPLSRDEVRGIDRRAIDEFHVPSLLLMENAGRGAAAWLAELGIAGPVVICCGKGNNGGDGYVMARHLDAWGYSVRVLQLGEPADRAADAVANARIVRAAGISVEAWDGDPAHQAARLLNDAAWVVDGLLGTGASGELATPVRSAIEAINRCAAPRFAIDIPSGLDCDSGAVLGVAVRASHTATLVAPKRGFENPQAAAYTGVVRVIDIGVPGKLLREYV